jgi:NAD(P)-dependent dehydrogenase (short-subunit alcohol dehydrogenase family)
MQLADSRIVILGGSTGIGFATAKAASAEGARGDHSSTFAREVESCKGGTEQ